MEPLILTLKPGASYKNFNPSESDTFIYCMSGQITLEFRQRDISSTRRRRFVF